MKIDHVHFYTRNAARTRDWFIHNVGFQAIGNCISQHTQTELIALNSAYFVISSPLNSASPVAQYLNHHPEGVADLAFRVKNLAATMERSRRLGVEIVQNIQLWQSPQGKFKFAQITGWQDLQHTLIEVTEQPDRSDAKAISDCCVPISLKPYNLNRTSQSNVTQITHIDHIVLNVAQGKLDSAVKLYQELFNFKVQQSFEIQTNSSGLSSQALIDDAGEVQFNINQPTTANSQIQEFIDVNGGSGIQHLALRSQNLIADVAQLHQKLKFLAVPPAYYKRLKPLLSLNQAERAAVIQQQILVDGDWISPQSLLMQIFTQPIFEQPTFFLELIERRHSAQGFGQGNFQALFEAVERQSKQLPLIHNQDRTTV
jgi:4-hydroxyphenylpyruvate dioxygenase